MDISSLKNYGSSLADFLGGKKAGYFDSLAGSNNLLETVGRLKAQTAATDTSAATQSNVTLSDEAKNILAAGMDGKETTNGIQKAAQNFMMSFFDQSGLDLENLSEDALKLITGLQSVIGGSNTTGRDITTDSAEEKYAAGNRKVYTLVGEGSRLRIAIDYKDGTPSKLSITDITGGQVETADFTLDADVMTVTRTQREYVNGHMTTMSAIDPLDVDLYTA